jgi:RimJ/RimL family protein N-acetyltransferase
MLKTDGVKLEFKNDALDTIAEMAYQRNMGARGLRSIIESVMTKIMFKIPDMEGAKKWLNTAMEYYKKYGYDFWAVRRRITGEFLGQMGIFRQKISGKDENCLAFMLGKKHWNMGYASEGAEACIDYAFRTLNLDRLAATVEPENLRSVCVLNKIGMEKTGKTNFLDKELYIYEISRKDKQNSSY